MMHDTLSAPDTLKSLSTMNFQNVVEPGASTGTFESVSLETANIQGTAALGSPRRVFLSYSRKALSPENLYKFSQLLRKWRQASHNAPYTPLLSQIAQALDVDSYETQSIFEAIQDLYLSHNRPRDRKIADRITALYRIVQEEGESISPRSLRQFTDFVLEHPQLDLPKITVSPEGMLRTRWISGPSNFVAIEFTGEPLVKLVAEIPRGEGQTATYFATERIDTVIPIGRLMGASI